MRRFTLCTRPYSHGTNVVWMLKEYGAQHDVKLVPFDEAMKSADYPAVSPMGKVPALKAGDTVPTEITAIIALLAEQFPDKYLTPAADSLTRGESYRWLRLSIHPGYTGFDRINHIPDSSERCGAISYGDLGTAFTTLHDHLVKHNFTVGDRFSALDVYFTALLNHFIRAVPMRDAPSVFATDEPVFSTYIDRHTTRPTFVGTMAWA